VVTGLRPFRQVVSRARGRAPAARALRVPRPGRILRGDRSGARRRRCRRYRPALALCEVCSIRRRALVPGRGSTRSAHRSPRRGGVDAVGFRAFSSACAPVHRWPAARRCSSCSTSSSKPSPPVRDRLGHSLDVLAILLGRLRKRVCGQSPLSRAAPRSESLFRLRARTRSSGPPLPTLGQQFAHGGVSVASAFPCLSHDAASSAMMKGPRRPARAFGFADEGAGFSSCASRRACPLLLRRIGSSILELYDGRSTARQGRPGRRGNVGYEAARAKPSNARAARALRSVSGSSRRSPNPTGQQAR